MNVQGLSAAAMYNNFAKPPIMRGLDTLPAQQANMPAAATAALGAQDLQDGECSTCASRAYTCSSGSVSRPATENTWAFVVAHEQAHLAEHRAEAAANGSRVVSQRISISTSVCAECNSTYVSGGSAHTKMESTSSEENFLVGLAQSSGCGVGGGCCGCGCCGSSVDVRA